MSFIFTARCTIVQSAVLRSHVVCPSVCLSVCNVGGSGYRLEILETIALTISPTPSRFVAQTPRSPPTYSQGTWENLGRLVGWEKVACWSTKAVISLKSVNMEENLLWSAYMNSPTLFRTVPSQPPTASSSQDWGFATPTQNFNRYYLRKG